MPNCLKYVLLSLIEFVLGIPAPVNDIFLDTLLLHTSNALNIFRGFLVLIELRYTREFRVLSREDVNGQQ
jgi:hypothetical protein